MAVPLLDAEDKTECRFCGESVSKDFRRVFGDQDDVAHRCRECDVFSRLQRGSAAAQQVKIPDPQENAQKHHHLTAIADGGVEK